MSLGQAVAQENDIATMFMSDTREEVQIGDRVLPTEERRVDSTFFPSAPEGDVKGQIISVFGGVSQVGQFDVVVANILAGPLAQFADSITSTLASRGMLALSGVLCEQAYKVTAAYDPWIEFDEPVYREQDDQTWSRLTGSRR